MSQMSPPPDASLVLSAILEAGRLLERKGSNLPADTLSRRARYLTAAALREVFEGLTWAQAALLIGEDDKGHGLSANVAIARSAKWWDDGVVEQVVGYLAADNIGEQAA